MDMGSGGAAKGGFWLPPALMGAALILFGVLIWVKPALLNYLVALTFILGGAALIAMALLLRGRVTYRKIRFGAEDDTANRL